MAYSRAYADNYAGIDWSAHRWSIEADRGQIDRVEAGRSGKAKAAYVMPDIAPFVSPVDFSVISSRSQLREHERKHQVRQCGELKTAEDFNWQKQNPQHTREKALEAAYRVAVEKHWRD